MCNREGNKKSKRIATRTIMTFKKRKNSSENVAKVAYLLSVLTRKYSVYALLCESSHDS